MQRKFLKTVTLVIIILLSLTACGKAEDAKSLFEYAKKTYGECTLISKSETKEGSEITVHDVLQDFDYSVSSKMSEINIDGSKFGTVPSKYDDFKSNLIRKVLLNVNDDIYNICNDSNLMYKIDEENMTITIYASDENEGKQTATKCAETLNKQNLKNRIDGFVINVDSIDASQNNSTNHIGSIKLPNTSWRTPQDEEIDYFIDYAKLHTDYKAKYLRKEQKTFADTGLSLEEDYRYYWETDYPNKMDYPVTFYYFESSKGNEYFITDFLYMNNGYQERYTNYTKGK